MMDLEARSERPESVFEASIRNCKDSSRVCDDDEFDARSRGWSTCSGIEASIVRAYAHSSGEVEEVMR